jgi:hypothetical protein
VRWERATHRGAARTAAPVCARYARVRMDDDERAEIARRGLSLIERAEQASPEALREKLTDAAKSAAHDAALGGVRAISGLVGGSPKRARIGPSAEAVEQTLARMEAESTAQFDRDLREAAARAAPSIDEREADALAVLRRSFPAESRELAVLLFACVDLLEDVAEIDDPPTREALARKEQLIARIGALLAPRAEPALRSFVEHVVSLSGQRRQSK